MTRIRSIVLGIVLAAPACHKADPAATPPDAETESAAPATSEAPSASASASAAPAQPPRHHGVVGMFFKAAHDLDVTDEAKAAFDSLEDPLRNDLGTRKEMSALHADLVASVKAGKIEASKIQADEAALSKSYAAHEEAQATALVGLHDAINADQRKTVADVVRAAAQAARERPAAPASDHGSEHGDHAGPEHGGLDHAEWAARRVERMKAQLVLDAEQQKQLTALLARQTPAPAAVQARMDAVKKQIEALATAFEKEGFDGKKIDWNGLVGHKPTEPADRQVRYLSELLPILTAGQRDRLALIMDHPRERGHGDSIADPPPDPSGLGPR